MNNNKQLIETPLSLKEQIQITIYGDRICKLLKQWQNPKSYIYELFRSKKTNSYIKPKSFNEILGIEVFFDITTGYISRLFIEDIKEFSNRLNQLELKGS